MEYVEIAMIFIAGVAFGWITKLPFLIKWYREFEKEKGTAEERIAMFFKKEETQLQRDLKTARKMAPSEIKPEWMQGLHK